MAMTVSRRRESQTPRVFMHKVADIRGGVSVNVKELGGDFLREGSVLSEPKDGICHVVKFAVLTEEANGTATTFKVKKGHNFKVGDFVMAKEGAKAYPISKIADTEKTYDTITISTSLGEVVKKGSFIIEAKAESASNSSALKFVPLSLSGTGKPVVQGHNFDTDAWLIGVTKGNPLPECIAKHLKGIINY